MNNEQTDRIKQVLNVDVHLSITDGLFKDYDKLRLKRESARDKSQIKHMLIVGTSGVGKTNQALKYLEANPPIVHKEFTQIPVVYCEVPDPFKLEDLYIDLLDQLGVTRIGRSLKSGLLKNQVIGQLKNNMTELVFLDEIQHIFSGSRDGKKVMNTLKHVANKAGVVLICVGKPEASALRTKDIQLFRRFQAEPFPRLSFNEDYMNVLEQFEIALGLQAPCGLADPTGKLAKTIYSMTFGVMHYINILLTEAAVLAIEKAHKDGVPEKITGTILKEVYLKYGAEFKETMRGNVLQDEKYINKLLQIREGKFSTKG